MANTAMYAPPKSLLVDAATGWRIRRAFCDVCEARRAAFWTHTWQTPSCMRHPIPSVDAATPSPGVIGGPSPPRFSMSLIPADIPGSFCEFSFLRLTRRLRQAPSVPSPPVPYARCAMRNRKGMNVSRKFQLIPHITKGLTPRSSFAPKALICFTVNMIELTVRLSPLLSTPAAIPSRLR